MWLFLSPLCMVVKRLIFPKKINHIDTCVTQLRVGLFDLDPNFHMNNGRFMRAMDKGRIDWSLRAGYLLKLVKHGYYPVVLSEAVIFKRSLHFLQRYDVHTRLYSWDKDFFYFEQRFVASRITVAASTVRTCFLERTSGKIVSIKTIFSVIGFDPGNGPEDDMAAQHIALDETMLPRSTIEPDS